MPSGLAVTPEAKGKSTLKSGSVTLNSVNDDLMENLVILLSILQVKSLTLKLLLLLESHLKKFQTESLQSSNQ